MTPTHTMLPHRAVRPVPVELLSVGDHPDIADIATVRTREGRHIRLPTWELTPIKPRKAR